MTAYLLEQQFRYEYSAPIRLLDHRLLVVPPAVHGDQRRQSYRVDVEGATAEATSGRDRFGNHVVRVRAPVVEREIEFRVRVEVARRAEATPAAAPVGVVRDGRFGEPTVLTTADDAVTGVARDMASAASGPLDLGERITTWVNRHMHYAYDVTDVRTTAAQALSVGAGVCQDYAHVMLAISRACGLPARYVSGHLAGEGGSHAWVEVLVTDAERPGRTVAVAFDPTHDRRAGDAYVTVATGRDYADVAPTSGTFTSTAVGRLSCRKRMEANDGTPTTAPAPAPGLVDPVSNRAAN